VEVPPFADCYRQVSDAAAHSGGRVANTCSRLEVTRVGLARQRTRARTRIPGDESSPWAFLAVLMVARVPAQPGLTGAGLDRGEHVTRPFRRPFPPRSLLLCRLLLRVHELGREMGLPAPPREGLPAGCRLERRLAEGAFLRWFTVSGSRVGEGRPRCFSGFHGRPWYGRRRASCCCDARWEHAFPDTAAIPTPASSPTGARRGSRAGLPPRAATPAAHAADHGRGLHSPLWTTRLLGVGAVW
jgi:hypothetical protein